MATHERTNTHAKRFRLRAASLLCLVAAACGSGDDQDSRLQIVSAESYSSNTVVLLVDGCGVEPIAAIVAQTDDVVEVEVRAGSGGIEDGGIDCFDSVEIELQSTLGDRELVDVTTSTAVSVTAVRG